jgi:hypothetical protein
VGPTLKIGHLGDLLAGIDHVAVARDVVEEGVGSAGGIVPPVELK